MNVPAQPLHPDKNHGLTGYLRGLRDPVAWSEQKFPGLTLDRWQQHALRLVADPPKDPITQALTNLSCWRTSRQMGKSQTSGLALAWFSCNKVPIRQIKIPGSPPRREVTDLQPTCAVFAAGVRQAEKTLAYGRDFLTAADVGFEQSSSDRIITESGSKLLALPASSTARGETIQLAVVDEAGHLEGGGEDVTGVIFPMMSSFCPSSTHTILASTPGNPQGLFYRCVQEPEKMRCNLVEASVSENPRITEDFLSQQRAILSDLFFSSEYCPIDAETGAMLTAQPPEFWTDGRGLFSIGALKASVTDEVEALGVPSSPGWG